MSHEMTKSKVRKFLSRKIAQLNDMIADMDSFVTQLGSEYYRVCIFGSARIRAGTTYYNQVRDLACALARRRVDIVTGGGPGIMEAANLGAKLARNEARSIGLPIELPFETDANSHLDVKYNHRRFSSRLDEFMRLSHAVVVTPGGVGTCLELFYTWQLLQVEHIRDKPLILYDEAMWGGLLDWVKKQPLERELISKKDLDFIKIANSIDEIMNILDPQIQQFYAAMKQPSSNTIKLDSDQ